MAFDYAGAKQAGFSDEQIAASLARTTNFDLDGALKAGHAYTEILPSLLARANTTAPNAEESLQQRIAAIKPDYTLGESLTKGVKRGVTQLGSTFGDVVPAMVGSALGFDDYAKRQMEEAAQTQQEIAATNAPEFQSYKDVHGLYDAAKFAAQVTGEQLPNLAVSLVPGVGAEMLAGRGALALAGEAATAGLGEQAAALAAKAAAQKQVAGYVGTYLGSYAQNAPEVFQNIYQDSGKLAPAAAALFSTASAALDSFLPASLIKNVTGPLKVGIVEKILERSGMDKGLLRSITSNVIKDTVGEGVTEGMQEGISEAAERFMNDHPEAFGQKDWDRIMESAVQGGLGGGVIGGIGGGVERYREGAQDKQRLADIREQRAARDAATKARVEDTGREQEISAFQQAGDQPQLPGIEPMPYASSLLPPTEEIAEPTVKGKAPKQVEMFTDQGTLTPAAETMESKDTKAAAIQARQAAQQQAADKKTGLAEIAPKNIDLLAGSRPPLDQVLGPDFVSRTQKDLDAAAAKQAKLQAGKPAAPAQAALPSVLPTDQKALHALFPGANPALGIFKENGPLWGRDLSDPVALKQVKGDLEAQKYSGKNATAVEEFLKRPEFQTTPTEDTSGQTKTVETKTQERPVGQETPAGADNTPAASTAATTGRTITAEELTALGVTKTALRTPNIKIAMDTALPAEQRATALEAHASNELVAKKPDVQQNLRNLASELRGVPTRGVVSEQAKQASAPASTPTEGTSGQTKTVETKTQAKAKPTPVAVTHETFFPEGRSEAEGINALVDAYTKSPKDPAINRVRIDAAARLSAPASKTLSTAIREVNKVIKPLFGPKYQGKSFDEATKALVRQGSIGAVLTKVASSANPEIARVLNRIKALGLKTKIVVDEAVGDKSGVYNSVTDTITLHPETGLNEHIFLHEVSHAALAHAIANPNLPITKQFAEFFNQIKDRMGDAYGGQDLQEFAAELVGNPEFQALLKTVKAPKSGSLFSKVMQAIAEFFGFRKGQSSYEAGLKFVSDLLDVSGDQKANPAEELFYGNGNVNKNPLLTSMIGDPGVTKDKLLNGLSNIKEFNSKVGALALVSLNNLDTMFGKDTKYNLPIRMLEKMLERKRTALDKHIDASGKKMGEINKVAAKYPEQIKRMSQMARDARRAGVDLLDPKFKPTASNQAEYTRLQNVHNTLHPDVRKVYATIRTDLDGHLAKFRDLVKSFLSPSAAQKLDAAFANLAGVTGYVPFMRYGDFWIEYADPVTGERTPRAFDSPRERAQEIAKLEAAYPKLKGQIEQKRNLQDIRAPKDLPAASFVGQIIAGMRANGASEDTVNSVYQQYISMFPASSIMKQFNKAKLLPGESEDVIRAYSDVNMRWAQKLVNTEFNPQILQAYDAVQSAADKFGGDTTIDAVKQSLANNRDSFLNLHYSGITNFLAQGSYIQNILGSVSSAAVNVSGLITSVHPVLGGRFGFDSAAASMLRAGRTAVGDWSKNPKYAELHKELGHLLKETVSREAWDREGGAGGSVFTNNLRKVVNLLSAPFNASERYMRGVTAIAAYDLALKGNASTSQKAMSKAEAIEFAGKTIKDLHTAGMAEVAPGIFKSNFGKVALTFKSIPFQQAFVIARAFHQAVVASDASPEVKQVARRQLLAMFGTSGALLGAAGLPFFGAYTVLARMLNAAFGDDDEPYDPTQQAISAAGSVFGNGLIANVFNISASQRMAMASDILWRDDPKSVQDNGYMKTAMFDLMGPMGSYFVNAERGVDEILKGQIERGFETLAPIAVRNAMKGARYWMDGATTLKGDPIESDINAYSALMQMTGFSPADLAEIQRVTGAEKTAEKAILTRKQRILDKYDMARRAGDYSMMQEAQQEAATFRQKYPKIMKGDTLQKSYKSFEQAKKEMVHGVRISKGLKQQLGEEFPIET